MEIVNSYVTPKRSILPLEYKYIVNRSALCVIDDKVKNENIKSVYYRLANNPVTKNKLLELKEIIEKRLFI